MQGKIQQARAWAQTWLQQEKRHYIDGQWVSGSQETPWQVIDPSNQQSLCTMALAAPAQVEAAASAAHRAHQAGVWSKVSRAERASVLRQIAQLIRDNTVQLAVLETLANGKLIGESLVDDIPTCADIFDYYAGWTDKYYGETAPVEQDFLNYTLNEPVGACALIAPWNFPLYQAALKVAPALAMGNTVVLKPSEYTPFTALYLFELIAQHVALPAGVANLLVTDGAAAQQLTVSEHIHKVSFTGSSGVGRKIIQSSGASNMKAVTLELGGKSPCIFFADTPDLDKAIDRAFTVMFSHKGEKCSEPTRFLIQEAIYDQVVNKLIAKAEAVKCGAPFDPASQQGPQCNQAQFDKIMGYIELGKQEAELVAGGYRDVSGSNELGLYIRPTIFSRVSPTARIATEEIFGPVLCCIAFDTEEEAIAIANGTEYGLAAGVYTADVKRAQRMANQIDAGMLFINRYGCYSLSSPFGGFRQSGWGKEMAIHSLSAYTKKKSVWVYHGDQ
ncbi:aldehyde dehydrogenase family protein [Aeromonas cavernicola]|uniref:Aldehyde dehydrogenase n=1 Tax=Aeromonas cavernicola TaxID=1006623 RepID=A0A2H9U8A4_9GAMM|nr:aldehyde dehydrogenase family protein [Aeromonas cavernicola]PJG60232.1 aldehyde dehydrogenase [Aeromonas cavernicola]